MRQPHPPLHIFKRCHTCVRQKLIVPVSLRRGQDSRPHPGFIPPRDPPPLLLRTRDATSAVCVTLLCASAGFPAWSVAQRAAAPVRNGAKLLGVGFAASMLGVGITNGLIAVRKALNPDYPDSGQSQNPLVVSSAYAAYMASSSNVRYQVVAGVLEERGIEVRHRQQLYCSSVCVHAPLRPPPAPL